MLVSRFVTLSVFTILVGSAMSAALAGAAVEQTLADAVVDESRPFELSRPGVLVEQTAVPLVRAAKVDRTAVALEDEFSEAAGEAPRFAIPNPVTYSPETDGLWEEVDEKTLVWRLRIASEGASSLNLGFSRYVMPEGGRLLVYSEDHNETLRPYTAADNKSHGELWTPIVVAEAIVVEVVVPTVERDSLELELTSINVGYRGFGEVLGLRQGYCNIDVVCPEGDAWRDEIQSVAAYQRSGSWMCTGFMVNNTNQDQTPYFMTANHCGLTSSTDSTLVVYWNFQSPNCGDLCCGSISQNQSGSTHLASYYDSDFTLVLLDDDPDPAWNVTFAGWNRTSANPTSAVAIHHPGVDEKAISFENDPCTTTDYYGTSSPGDGTHIRVTDWDLGTTEGGSSGSPLFDQNHRVVGQLHGGDAACGNNYSDWYGRFSASWSHGLSTYLDPTGTGATVLDILVPGASGMSVSPAEGLESSGDPGGPFSPSSKQYVIENQGSLGLNYQVSKTQSWVSITNGSGYIPAWGDVTVTVSINATANSLSVGSYSDTVSFVNTTSHQGDTTRGVSLQVGGPSLVYDFPMDTNPGWTTQGLWAFGHPSGGGGVDHGESDPSNGYTGSYVYGYNLSGDYENDLPERHLTSTVLDCTNVSGTTLKFMRWLNVERDEYDHAYLRVSNNGTNWTTLWQNGQELTDSAWVAQEYDISAVADGQPTVYLRWTMGETDESWQYSGWNIDDVEVWGINTGCTGDEQCDDSDVCNGAETCQAGVCVDGTELVCQDGNPCTDDYCDSVIGCSWTPNTESCNDGDPCTEDDVCAGGVCGGTLLDCDGDTVCDLDDNCPTVYNPLQGDADGDDYGDACDGQFDADHDGDVDLTDLGNFVNCVNGPAAAAAPVCRINHDTDGDNDVDLADFAGFQEGFTGTIASPCD